MQRLLVLTSLVALFLSVPVAADDEIIHQARWRTIDFNRAFVEDLTHPEGKTRWELGGVVLTDTWIRTIRETGDGLSVLDSRRGASDPVLYDRGARDWWMPHLSTTSFGEPLDYVTTAAGETRRVSIRTKKLSSGWVFLPSGPRQVTLQRSHIKRTTSDRSATLHDLVIYRWVDLRAGAVAEVWGRAGNDGASIVELEGAAAAEEILRGGIGLTIYSDEIELAPFQNLTLGFDRMGTCTVDLNPCVTDDDCMPDNPDICTIPVSDVTTVAHATIGDLVSASSWDFTPTQLADSRYEIGSTKVPINSAETCNYQQCGFSTTTNMGREDKNFSDASNSFITLSAQEGEDRGTDYTIWLRGAVRWEGISGGLGDGESRTCYEGAGRTEVPLWRFANSDAGGWYMQNGDSWGHAPFACENNIFNHVCPNGCGLFCNLWIRSCSTTPEPGEGQQSGAVIGEGPVTLPSGHTLNALLVHQVVDFCVYLSDTCGLGVNTVHQELFLWIVPNIGTVARLMSELVAPDDLTFTDLSETDLKYGLFPPRSITQDGVTDTTISISWDPGTVTHHIDGYKVYWDTDTGSSSAYAFDSVNNPGQVGIVGTTATISGLNPATDYYITVTALSDFTDISTGVTTTYESLLFPRTTSGASGPLPPELVAATTGGACTPTFEITGVTMDKVGGSFEICWAASPDPCIDGYSILGAATPELAANFSTVVGDTGPVMCHTFDPTETFFIIVGKGTGGTGPWGHFGM